MPGLPPHVGLRALLCLLCLFATLWPLWPQLPGPACAQNAPAEPTAAAPAAGTAPPQELQSAAPPAAAAPVAPVTETRELWEGGLYTSTYRVGVCLEPDGNMRGVLLLRLASGKVDVYHIYGTFENGVIRARHSSGHTFKGRFDDAHTVSGVITLKSGRTVRLSGERRHDAVLSQDTCRPPE